MYVFKSSVRWSRQERTYSALVTHRLDIWKKTQVLFEVVSQVGLIQPWSRTDC